MAMWFTGCLQLNHINIIQYNDRPFNDTDDMNEVLIDNINKHVKENDKLYIVGNCLFGPLDNFKFIKTARWFRNKIKCNFLFLNYGNHDRRAKNIEEFNRLFIKTTDYMEIVAESDNDPNDKRTAILSAWPIEENAHNRVNKGAWHLFSSTKLHKNREPAKRFNIGVDFAPQNLLKIAGKSIKDISVEELRSLYRPYSLDELKYILDPIVPDCIKDQQ